MMLPAAIVAAGVLAEHGVQASVLNVPVIKPLDTTTVLDACARARAVVVAENHSVIGGLGSAVAEALAEAGLGRRLRRVGVQDVFAGGARTFSHLFDRYGLSAKAVIDAAWSLTASNGPPPAPPPSAETGAYAPV
jgi:transketolase